MIPEEFQEEIQDLGLDVEIMEKIKPIFTYYERQLKGCGDDALRLGMINLKNIGEIKNLNNVITLIKEIFDDGSWDDDTFAPKLEKILELYSKSKTTKKKTV